MRIFKLQIISVLSFLTIQSFGQDTHDSTWKTFENQLYKIEYPSGWKVDVGNSSNGNVLVLYAPLHISKFRTYMTLNIRDSYENPFQLSEIMVAKPNNTNCFLTNIDSIASSKFESATGPCLLYKYVAEACEHRLKVMVCLWKKDKKTFMLRFEIERKYYDLYKENIVTILNSFIIKK